MCPLMVCSSSPSSQSQTLIVQSSEPEATEEKRGWKAKQLIESRCPSSACLDGVLGSQEAGSWFRFDRELGVALSTSDCSAAFLASSSRIYSLPRVQVNI